jgi:hypothetical protein
MFPPGGKGIIASSDAEGRVNIAVYARPHVVDERTLAWGMTEGRTWSCVKGNPRAAFLYLYPGPGYAGVRLSLVLKELRNEGEMLEEIRTRTAEIVSPAAAAAVNHVAFFEVEEVRPLV